MPRQRYAAPTNPSSLHLLLTSLGIHSGLLAQPLPSGLVLPDRAVLLSSLLYITVLSAACLMVSHNDLLVSAEVQLTEQLSKTFVWVSADRSQQCFAPSSRRRQRQRCCIRRF